ncbi:MAG: hypothetical protein WHT08_08625 [Bryobacteraceae bacterium]|jgi:hypothetical protein
MTTLQGVLVLTVVALAAAVWIAWRIQRALQVEEADSAWWDNFDPDKYSPLLYLLDSTELQFLRTQHGCNRRLLRSFRAERARICRQFLREMKEDFRRLQAVGQALVVANRCAEDFPEELFRQRVRFSIAWWRMRVGLAAWQLGLPEPDSSALLDSMQASAARVRMAIVPAV